MEYEVQVYYSVTQTVSAGSEEEAIELAFDIDFSLEDVYYCDFMDPDVRPAHHGSNNPDL